MQIGKGQFAHYMFNIGYGGTCIHVWAYDVCPILVHASACFTERVYGMCIPLTICLHVACGGFVCGSLCVV